MERIWAVSSAHLEKKSFAKAVRCLRSRSHPNGTDVVMAVKREGGGGGFGGWGEGEGVDNNVLLQESPTGKGDDGEEG